MLAKVAEYHNIWIAMLLNMGCRVDNAEDLVQEMYIKLDRLIKSGTDISYGDNDINRAYVYRTLWSLFIDGKRKKKIQMVELVENMVEGEEDIVGEYEAEDDCFNGLTLKVRQEMNTWHQYYSSLCKLYFSSDYSMRDLAKELDCGVTHVYHTINTHRDLLRDKFSEDWEDFKNKDYDK